MKERGVKKCVPSNRRGTDKDMQVCRDFVKGFPAKSTSMTGGGRKAATLVLRRT